MNRLYIDRRGLHARQARYVLMLAVSCTVAALTMLGHVVVLAASALDAYAASLVGVPRLAYLTGRIVEIVRECARKENL
ncbi:MULTISPECIES: hypothetical protein [Nonomuraea]|uniref:Uncharacterized protein n=2 Tax=Nonomuraea TaxID=83681 RepID=A0A1V0AAP3_9ACTN|nr:MULTISPECIES: hypothetical protein [Nonomuraea]AQZ67249.1 hypothetical protein BKM31_42520 [Nonomuraea sp. ATCC 55076]UBU13986.1 hypothetical protein LCN96_02825 [Nonomuraea gerenzanensis]SBO91672.1 hypothetical protein BN4615_P1186 [Nonomuraea gerenzanensis]SPL94534.1 unnamed protein product [Actinomadura parvosata subsp. kistnae]